VLAVDVERLVRLVRLVRDAAVNELVLGADPDRALGEPANFVQAGLPLRRMGLVSHEGENLPDWASDLHSRFLVDHRASSGTNLRCE